MEAFTLHRNRDLLSPIVLIPVPIPVPVTEIASPSGTENIFIGMKCNNELLIFQEEEGDNGTMIKDQGNSGTMVAHKDAGMICV